MSKTETAEKLNRENDGSMCSVRSTSEILTGELVCGKLHRNLPQS